jgi:prepilin-type processing-associated H-X9-DG protein
MKTIRTIAAKKLRFTLMELLAVIVIAALLVAMILPALGHAGRVAESKTCLNNLKQQGAALMRFLEDHDGVMPLGSDTPPYAKLWNVQLAKYLGLEVGDYKDLRDNLLGTGTALDCPARKQDDSNTYGGHYAFTRPENNPFPKAPVVTRYDALPPGFFLIGDARSYRIWSPTAFAFDTDGDGDTLLDTDENRGLYNKAVPRHEGRFNFLFVGGNAKAVTIGEFVTNKGGIY